MRNPFICLVVLFTVTTLASSAQQEPVMTWPEMKPFKKTPPIVLRVNPVSDSGTSKPSQVNSLYIKEWYHAGVQVNSVPMGKVYRMPIDNMLCIVPDATKNSRMPVKRARQMPKMPNAYKGPGMNK